LIQSQSKQLKSLDELEITIYKSCQDKQNYVKEFELKYQKAAQDFNDASTQLIRIKNFIIVDSQLYGEKILKNEIKVYKEAD
jgi:hypothetical protein